MVLSLGELRFALTSRVACFCLQKHVFRRRLKKNDGNTVAVDGDRLVHCVEVCFVTGPRPIFPLCDEPATDGILVDVSNFLMHISVAAQAEAWHPAAATVAGADLIISWNFKHIVHFDKIRRNNAINTLQGYRAIDIRSPQEVVGYEEENI